jgi:TonB family protein
VKVPVVKTPETTLRISGTAGSNPYWARVQSIISSQWEPPPVDMTGQSYTYTMIVKFRLQRDGTIKDVVVQQSSGNAYFDMAGQRAVLRPRVLPVFPADMADSYKDVEMVFRVGESAG